MRIVHRMLIAPLACVGMMLAVGLASGYALRVVSNALDDLYSEHLARVIGTQSIESELSGIHAGAYSLFASLDGMGEAKVAARLKSYDRQLDAMVTTLGNSLSAEGVSGEARPRYESVALAVGKYKKAIDTAIDMATMDANMGRSGMQTADDVFKEVSSGVASLVRLETEAATSSYEHASSVRHSAYVLCGFLLLAAIVVSVGLSLVMARAIAVPLQRSVKIAERIARGDLSQTIEDGSQDEIGKLASALAVMQDGLRSMIANTSETAKALQEASHGMADAADAVTHSVHKQSDALADATARVEDLTLSISQVSQSAGAVTRTAEETSHTAIKGARLVEQVTAEVRGIADTVDSSAASIEALRDSTMHISGIANVIREIAEQTNLLALNAAIEAARAGDSGRGFAVVADEVRKLAEKTSSATQDIKEVIEGIGVQSGRAVSEMTDVRVRVEAGVQVMESLREPLQMLERGADEALCSMRELSVSVQEQLNASNSIARNVDSISGMGNVNAAAAQRSQQTVAALQTLSRQLCEGIERFHV